jgi:hypothetical protein
VVGNVPAIISLDTQISAVTGGGTSLKGWGIMRVVGAIVAVPTVAPGATAKDMLTIAMGITNEHVAATSQRPDQVFTVDEYPWMWLEDWYQPYIAAPVGASQVIEARRLVRIKKRRGGPVRVYRADGDRFTMALSSPGNVESWSVQGRLRILRALP